MCRTVRFRWNHIFTPSHLINRQQSAAMLNSNMRNFLIGKATQLIVSKNAAWRLKSYASWIMLPLKHLVGIITHSGKNNLICCLMVFHRMCRSFILVDLVYLCLLLMSSFKYLWVAWTGDGCDFLYCIYQGVWLLSCLSEKISNGNMNVLIRWLKSHTLSYQLITYKVQRSLANSAPDVVDFMP